MQRVSLGSRGFDRPGTTATITYLDINARTERVDAADLNAFTHCLDKSG